MTSSRRKTCECHRAVAPYKSTALLLLFFCLSANAENTEQVVLESQSEEAEAAQHGLKHNPFARNFKAKVQVSVDTATGNTVANANAAPPKLRAVLFAEKEPLADISGKIVGLGDEYEGYTVKIIGRDHITLEKSGQITELSLQEALMAGAEQ